MELALGLDLEPGQEKRLALSLVLVQPYVLGTRFRVLRSKRSVSLFRYGCGCGYDRHRSAGHPGAGNFDDVLIVDWLNRGHIVALVKIIGVF